MNTELSRVLPLPAAVKLRKASLVLNTEKDPNAQTKAVNEAIRWVRSEYPQYFKKESSHEN